VPSEGGRGAVHLRIIRALQDGDAEASIAAMQQHFDDIRVRAALVSTRPAGSASLPGCRPPVRRPASDAG
jgi:DNA-binding GntR family transcriptional regulator